MAVLSSPLSVKLLRINPYVLGTGSPVYCLRAELYGYRTGKRYMYNQIANFLCKSAAAWQGGPGGPRPQSGHFQRSAKVCKEHQKFEAVRAQFTLFVCFFIHQMRYVLQGMAILIRVPIQSHSCEFQTDKCAVVAEEVNCHKTLIVKAGMSQRANTLLAIRAILNREFLWRQCYY